MPIQLNEGLIDMVSQEQETHSLQHECFLMQEDSYQSSNYVIQLSTVPYNVYHLQQRWACLLPNKSTLLTHFPQLKLASIPKQPAATMGTSTQKHLSHSPFTTEACQLTKQQQRWACLPPRNSTFHTHLSPWKLASIHLVSRAFFCLVLGQYNNISSLP